MSYIRLSNDKLIGHLDMPLTLSLKNRCFYVSLHYQNKYTHKKECA